MKLLKEIFKELDADGSGTVTPKEFNTQIKKKHIQEKLYKYFGTRTMNQMVEAWKTMDADGSGEMTLDEFLASTGAVSEINKENAAADQNIGANLLSAGAEDDYVSSKDPLRYGALANALHERGEKFLSKAKALGLEAKLIRDTLKGKDSASMDPAVKAAKLKKLSQYSCEIKQASGAGNFLNVLAALLHHISTMIGFMLEPAYRIIRLILSSLFTLVTKPQNIRGGDSMQWAKKNAKFAKQAIVKVLEAVASCFPIPKGVPGYKHHLGWPSIIALSIY
jgi:hypothetical protein